MRTFKLGLLGCGMIAERGHLPTIRNTPGIEIEAVYDINLTRAQAMQQKFSIPLACNTEEEFWSSKIDAVVICTPAPLHHRNVHDAARFGKHVLCEKPLAMIEEDIVEMDVAMQKAGLQFYAGFNYRFSPSSIDIHRLVRENAIGEVRSLRLVYLWNLHGKYLHTEKGVRELSPLRVGRMMEGGPMVDCGVHQIDLARWWLGSEVVSQHGIGIWVEDYEAPDHMYLHLGHENGVHTMVEMSFSYNVTSKEPRKHFQYELIGTDGVIRYNREEHNFELCNSFGTQHLPWHPEKNFAGMYTEFAKALATGQPGNMPTARDGLIATRIARKATEQAMRDRDPASKAHRSTMVMASDIHAKADEVPLDKAEPSEIKAELKKDQILSASTTKG